MQQLQQQQAQLEIQLKKAQIAKVNAEKDNIEAQATENRLKGIYVAIQTVNASNPVLASAYDALYQSAGGTDANGFPLINKLNNGQNINPIEPTNTHPNLPPTPPMPQSPGIGAEHGIITPENDGADNVTLQ